jgi:hypothetical protein
MSVITRSKIARDLSWQGSKSILVTVTNSDTGVPIYTTVELQHNVTRAMLRRSISDPVTGQCLFSNLAHIKFTVEVVGPPGFTNGVARDILAGP